MMRAFKRQKLGCENGERARVAFAGLLLLGGAMIGGGHHLLRGPRLPSTRPALSDRAR